MMTNQFEYNYLSNPSINVKVLSKGNLSYKKYINPIALPIKQFTAYDGDIPVINMGGGLTYDGKIITNSTAFSNGACGYEVSENEIEEIDEDIIWISILRTKEWGHAITDSLKHLWWFESDEYKNHYFNLPIYCIIPAPIKGNFKLLFKSALGENGETILDKIKFVTHPIRFKSAIIPDNCFESGSAKLGIEPYVSEEYIELINRIVSTLTHNNKIKCFDKLYLARKRDKRTWTSKKLENILKANGFHKIYPEDYSLTEQITLLQNVKELVAPVDSCAHNAIFCKDGTKVYLLRKCNEINKYQKIIDKARNLDVSYIDCHLSIMNFTQQCYSGPFFIYPNNNFCNCFNTAEIPPFPKKEFRKYCNYPLYCLSDARLNVENEYLNILAQEIHRMQRYYENHYSYIKKFPLIPTKIKERVFIKLVKTQTRRFW